MEDTPAGKSSNEIPSPKKVSNPIGTQSQWSFGWQSNDRPVFNRANDSKGTSPFTQASTAITTRAASSSVIPRAASGSRKKCKPARRTPLSPSPFGTITPKLLAKPLWCWEKISPITGRRMR